MLTPGIVADPGELRKDLANAARCTLHELAIATAAAQVAVAQLVDDDAPTSGAGYLRRLDDLIGAAPAGSAWMGTELPAMLSEECHERGEDIFAVKKKFSFEAYETRLTPFGKIERDVVAGQMQISKEDAQLVSAITASEGYYSAPMARALREEQSKFAGATHYICGVLARQLAAQLEEGADKKLPKTQVLYRHLHGKSSLVDVDPEWEKIERADRTGFQGIVSTSIIRATCAKACLGNTDGFSPSIGDAPKRPMKSAVVRFEIPPDDKVDKKQGTFHSPIMIGRDTGIFPPNTLFRLNKTEETGFFAKDADGGNHWIKQRCLVVSATFQSPGKGTDADGCGKMSAPVVTLQYGNREAYIRGLHDITAKPVLTMVQEFQREKTWKDWKGVEYNLRDQWAYVIGAAEKCEGCTPGTRDENNHGKIPQVFLNEINELIRQRRKERKERGDSLELADSYAELTMDEVMAVRLYTGPAYHPINEFLRQISLLKGGFRTAAAQNVDLTFAASVGHICHAIRKISAVATEVEVKEPLFRAVRGVLPKGFWAPDHGLVCATDCAFMSTSKVRATPIHYMDTSPDNVLWEMFPEGPSDAACHYGADVTMLSQFAAEKEVLFPPATMLVTRRREGDAPDATLPKELQDVVGTVSPVDARVVTEEPRPGERKSYVAIKVVPHFQ